MNEGSKNESDIIKKIQNGDNSAYNVMILKYQNRIYSTLLGFLKSPQDAEDLMQQAFVKGWQTINKFRGESSFYTWIYRIAINLAKNHLKKSSVVNSSKNISSEQNEIEFSVDLNPLHELEREQLKFRLKSFIAKLPESLRTAFLMREEEGKTYEEISRATDCPIGTVRSRIFRAREEILNFFEDEIRNG